MDLFIRTINRNSIKSNRKPIRNAVGYCVHLVFWGKPFSVFLIIINTKITVCLYEELNVHKDRVTNMWTLHVAFCSSAVFCPCLLWCQYVNCASPAVIQHRNYRNSSAQLVTLF
jgi:hypothetical protein